MGSQKRCSKQQLESIIQLHKQGYIVNHIATLLDLPWRTVKYWVGKEARVAELVYASRLKRDVFGHMGSNPIPCTIHFIYAYILGLYLGDGYIAKTNRDGVHKLRITQTSKYVELIHEHVAALQQLFPTNKVSVYRNKKSASVEVVVYSSHLLELFPQHGVGFKHARDISLTDWQQEIVNTYPTAFIRGLFQSDGSRYISTQNNKRYVRYNFTNTSQQIVDLLIQSTSRLKMSPTIVTRPRQHYGRLDLNKHLVTVTFNKRCDVCILENIVGEKK